LALTYFEAVRLVVGWCELRRAFRHFRTDRIISMRILDARYPGRRAALLKQWYQEVRHYMADTKPDLVA